MAKMIGKLIVKDWCGYGCCTTETSKNHVKREEMKLALREAEEEIEQDLDLKHSRGICYDQHSKSYGCDECYNDNDYYPPEDLEGIAGVTFGQR